MFGEKQKIVTRMAPSPTGHLHVGTARTALFNYLYAKHHGGIFIMRSEDTDNQRSTQAYEEEITEGLIWLGLEWDEYYRQSERTDIYHTYLQKIVKSDLAYVSKEPSKHNPDTEVEVIRLRNTNKVITFEDEIRGEVTFDTTDLGDFVIARSLHNPLYHFAVVVDDHEMGVTHVIRGEDHISNTPRQILIQEALGIERPTYAHLPLLLGADRSKLSKRHGAVSLSEYHNKGFLPQAVMNYLALLGWNPGTDKEFFTKNELIEELELSGVQKGGAIFDIEKLRWFNKEHLQQLSDSEYVQYIDTWIPKNLTELPQYSDERKNKLIPAIRERIYTGEDVHNFATEGEYDFAFTAPTATLKMLKWKKDESTKDALPRLQKIAEILSTIPDICTIEDAKDKIFPYAETVGKGEVLWPLRVALTGRERSPDPFTVIHIIGSSEAYKRVKSACDTIISA